MKLEPIDTSTTAGKAEVMRLAADGRKVVDDAGGEWTPINHPCWNWEEYKYAIIAEPVGPSEVFIVVDDYGNTMGHHAGHEEALSFANGLDCKAVRYIRADLAGEAKNG